MSHTNVKRRNPMTRIFPAAIAAILLLTVAAHAAVPGISGSTFSLSAHDGYSTQPDGAQIYSWGYSCAGANPAPTFVPFPGNCPVMQIPGPTLFVNEGQVITVNLTNNLPAGAGNTSIVFSGFQVTGSGGTAGLLAQEAATGQTVTYTFTATAPGTHAYYSGTQGDLQIEMGLYGALIVLPKSAISGCKQGPYSMAANAYDHPETCYDREYLFQWAEMDPRIHRQAEQQVQKISNCSTSNPTGLPCPTALSVAVEPYHPAYFLINGRSMPDDMDPAYAPNYPNQPYNGNPHMHPGDLVLLRVIGQGRLQHPFHEHANHVRILARDGNLILSQNDSQSVARLAGRMEFTTDTTPGQAFDGIFYWTGKGLGWDIYGHTLPTTSALVATATENANTVTITTGLPLSSAVQAGQAVTVSGLPAGYNGTFTIQSVGSNSQCSTANSPGNCVLTYTDPVSGLAPSNNTLAGSVSIVTSLSDPSPCIPDANGYYTAASGAPLNALNYYEWCADHNHPLETNPVGQVGGAGPITLPDPLIMTNGLWYNGTPYLGPDAVLKAKGPTPLPPNSTTMNPTQESGIAFMWHSHNEREITTNDVFPGGMLMMMLVDPPVFVIDETL